MLDIPKIKQELVVFLRNQDILSTTERGVTTTNATGTVNGTTITINRTNVKNIRYVKVGGTTKKFGSEWTADYNHANGCVITFASSQSGNYDVEYDYGSDKIYPDFPRDDLSINSYPRIAVEVLNANEQPFGIGGTKFISDVTFTVIVYYYKTNVIDQLIQDITDAFKANAKSFYYLSYVAPGITGPLIVSSNRSNEIMQRNKDFVGRFNTS